MRINAFEIRERAQYGAYQKAAAGLNIGRSDSRFVDVRDLRIQVLKTKPKNVFLSHASVDDEAYAAGALEILGGPEDVFVDHYDLTQFRHIREIAAQIKSAIHLCNKFVLLASRNSRSSLWVPWELGVSDSAKTFNNIAIFPYEKNWATGAEYLEMYAQIYYDEGGWVVLNPETKKRESLTDWLRNG